MIDLRRAVWAKYLASLLMAMSCVFLPDSGSQAARSNPAPVNFFMRERPDSSLSGPAAEVFTTIVRVELFSDSCFHIGQRNENLDEYSDRAWRCIMTSELPGNCAQASDAILRSVRFVRFNPNFAILQRSVVGIIDRCIITQPRSMNDLYLSRSLANFLDLEAVNGEHATTAQVRLVERYLHSSETHSTMHPPIGQFIETMCGRLVQGRFAEPESFWLLFCNSDNLISSTRADRSHLIDTSLRAKGLYD